jgi:signal transduction histidine kinase
LLALKAGAKDFVSKPFDLEELLVRVQNMLEVRLLNVEVNKLNGRLIAEDALLQDEIGERNRIADTLRRAQAQLSGYAGQLEGLVAERTSELAAANKKLEASVSIVQKANNEHQALFLESNGMREKLSQLTRQIIRAQEEMRKEISRELHDGVVQSLIAVGVQLAALGKGASLEARNVKRISNIRKLVEKSVIEVHRFARELRPSVLDDLGLVPALIAYNKSLAEGKKIKISMTVFVGVEALGDDQRTMLFRVAQEALANVVRHARATQVKMSICEIPDAVRMEISDNGRSFLVEKVVSDKNPKRLGLVGMKERVEMVGGQLTIVSERSRGTTVRVEIPFARKQMAGVPEAN